MLSKFVELKVAFNGKIMVLNAYFFNCSIVGLQCCVLCVQQSNSVIYTYLQIFSVLCRYGLSRDIEYSSPAIV